MIQVRKPSEETKDFKLSAMDVKAPKESAMEGNPLASTIADPLCKLNLKETSEFVKAFPVTATTSAQRQRRSMEAPSTPGRRPVFSFSGGNPSRKSVPSKWDDAEKWVISGSCNESPAHVTKVSDPWKISRPNGVLYKKCDAFAENLRVDLEKVASFDTALHCLATPEVILQDKFTNNVEPPYPNFRFSSPTNENFLFRGSFCESMKTATSEEIPHSQQRDIGTEMTPLGSVATTRCHTPIKSSSPARHNSPYESGPLMASNTTLDISVLKDCHFSKLQLSAQYDSMVSNWSSREEEEAEVSKSLRHTEMGGGKKSFAETRASLWEGEERTKICIRYQREEAKIQAWLNLQNAKIEAQSRKVEVKIQKIRSNLEEKMMKRMAFVQRRAAEWRAAAQLQYSQQILRASEQAQKMRSLHSSPVSCGCFPCSNHS